MSYHKTHTWKGYNSMVLYIQKVVQSPPLSNSRTFLSPPKVTPLLISSLSRCCFTASASSTFICSSSPCLPSPWIPTYHQPGHQRCALAEHKARIVVISLPIRWLCHPVQCHPRWRSPTTLLQLISAVNTCVGSRRGQEAWVLAAPYCWHGPLRPNPAPDMGLQDI